MDYINIIKDKFHMYYGDYIFLIMVIIACFFLALEDKETKKKLIYPLFFVAFCVLCPVLYKYVFKDIVYWRLFWIIPDTMIISIAIVKLIKKAKSNLLKVMMTILSIGIIVGVGENVFTNATYTSVENGYKISQETVDVCEIISKIDEEPRCIIPKSIYSEIRQYSGDIELMYGRNVQGYIGETSLTDEYVYRKMKSKSPQYETILAVAKKENYNFIVCEDSKPIDEDILMKYNFYEVGSTENYLVYYADETMGEGWLVTQLGDNSQWENTSYVLENSENQLIIIDGGRGGNNEKLLELIGQHNNHIDAWILTSPQREHIGAFNKIVSENEHLVIDKIYTIDVNYEMYSKKAKEYEHIEYYEEYRNLTKNMDNIVFVYEGDVIDLCGLEMEIINAWSEDTDSENTMLAKRGAMAFSIKNKEDIMLFCSDVLGDAENNIKEKIKTIDYDYIQIDNHGKGNLSQDVYNSISADAVFIDIALNKVSEDDRNYVESTTNILRENDIEIYTLDTTPNAIILK